MRHKLKIAFGDLRHNTIGRHSVCMPLSISTIASYLLTKIDKERLDIRFYCDPHIILKEIEKWKPDVVALSHYMWNSSIANLVFRYAKSRSDDVICVAGGPNFPSDYEECEAYLLEHDEIDFYVFLEAEVSFAGLIEKIISGSPIEDLKLEPQSGIMHIDKYYDELCVGNTQDRISNLDDIPSPYLTGLMDKWFNGEYAPFIETNRGCPFSCAFCHAGSNYYNKITRFSSQRIKNELDYIVQKMEGYPHSILYMADNNFGMYKEDEVLSKYLSSLQDKYGWPETFDGTTGKRNYDRILKISSVLKNKMKVTCSCQTLNEATLKAIKRKNIPMDEYKMVQDEIKKQGMLSTAELIVPLPEETRDSFFDGVKQLINVKVDNILVHTTILLPNTHLSSKNMRDKYKMKTKYRIVPRQFGEYQEEKCFEIEEVCIETNTMTFDEYLDARGFMFVSSILSYDQFDIIKRFIIDLNIDIYEFYSRIWSTINFGSSGVSDIYKEYMDETKNELWDSEENLVRYFSKEENYEKLLNGELGDNLVRKYTIKTLLFHHKDIVNILYDTLICMMNGYEDDELFFFLDDTRKWILDTRELSNMLCDKKIIKVYNLCLSYDVYDWYIKKEKVQLFRSYKKNTNYRVSYNISYINNILQEVKELFGNLIYGIGKVLINRSPKDFWKNCETI